MRLLPFSCLLLAGLLLNAGQEATTAAETKTSIPAPPLPVPSKSPIDYFRQLIGASTAERSTLLGGKTAEHRRVLEASLQTYDNLPADEREVRLRTMELRYYFNAVLRGPATNRAVRLQALPELYREAVASRLKYWDGLPYDLQQQLQEHERVIRVLGPGVAKTNLATLPVRANLEQWKALPEPRRQQIEEGFTRIFEMTKAERIEAFQEVAGKLSAAEREQMEKAMNAFRTRSPSQRAQVLSGFQKFAGLSAEERRQFMRNAEVWANMKPSDRQKWRETVAKLPPMPPMPPGFNLPPTPPIPRPVVPATMVVTNGYR